MHWNVAPDALPVSVRLVRVLDRWRNDCKDGTFACLPFENKILSLCLYGEL